jgi:Fe-S-cluster containining protein
MIIKKSGFNFRFDDSKCFECGGKCCTGASGDIWVNKDEISALSSALEMDSETFKQTYLKKVFYKYSIREYKTSQFGYVCVFFDTELKQCQVYENRPKQCRTFPFWNSFKDNIDEVKKECIAVI